MTTDRFYNIDASCYSEYAANPLSSEENTELFYKWRTEGDPSVRDEIICRNLKLVVSIANKYVSLDNALDMDDIVQTGIIGLIRAVDSYNPDRGYAFSTYAAKCIRNTLNMLWRKYKYTKIILSLDELLESDSDDGYNLTLVDAIEDPRSNFTQDIENQCIVTLLDQYLDDLPDRSKVIFCMLYGLRGYEQHKQREVAKMLNCTTSNISRANTSSIKYLRDKLIDDLFK